MQSIEKEDDSNGSVVVIGATNSPWSLDSSMLKLFHKKIYIPLPDVLTRQWLIKLQLGKESSHSLTDKDFEYLATLTEG